MPHGVKVVEEVDLIKRKIDHNRMLAEVQREVSAVLREAPKVDISKAKLPGDVDALRGLPAIGRNVGRRAVVTALVAAAILSGCGGEDTGTEASPGEPQAREIEPGANAPGRYETTVFQPALSFNLLDGWRIGGTELEEDFDLLVEEADDTGISVVRVQSLFDPAAEGTKDSAQAAPSDLEGWVRSHPHLQVDGSNTTTIGGHPAVTFDVTITSGYSHARCPAECVLFGSLSSGEVWGALVGDRAKLVVADVNGENVVFLASAPASKFPDFLAMAEEILESVDFVADPQ